MVGDADDAERRPELAAGQWPGVAVGQQLERPVRRHAAGCAAPLAREPAVVVGRLEDDRLGLRPERVGDDVPVGVDTAGGVVAGQHPVHRPAQVDRRRSRLADARGGPADRRLAGMRSRVPQPVRDEGDADGADLADRRCAADDHVPDRVGHVCGGTCLVLDELARELALVDEQEPRVRPTGTRSGTRSAPSAATGRSGASRGGAEHRGAGLRIEDRRRCLGCRALEGGCDPDDGRGRLGKFTGELPEEPPPSEVGPLLAGRTGAPPAPPSRPSRPTRRAASGAGWRAAPVGRSSEARCGRCDRYGQ